MSDPVVTTTPSGIEIRFEEEAHTYEIRYPVDAPALFPGQGYCPDWKPVPSVSTVLKATENKEGLVAWAWGLGAEGMIRLYNMGVTMAVSLQGKTVLGANDKGNIIVLGQEEAKDILKKHGLTTDAMKKAGGTRGTSAHAALEVWAQTGNPPNPAVYPPSEQPYVIALRDFLEDAQPEPVRTEVMVASLKYELAGRFDIDLLYPTTVEVQDHWTPKGRGDTTRIIEAGTLERTDLKTSKDVFDEHTEQLEGYEKLCIESGFGPSDRRAVLQCGKEGKYKSVPSYSIWEDFEITLAKWQANQVRKQRKAAMVAERKESNKARRAA